MSFLKNLLHNKTVVSIVCGIICVIIIFFAYRSRVNEKVKAITVPYALEEIESRTEITKDMIGSVKVASSMLTDNILRNEKDVIGKFANYNTNIPKGSLFYSSSIVDWKDMPDSAWSNIEDGHTVVSLSVSGYTMFKKAIYPNAIIDLYYQTYTEDEKDTKLVYGKLIENIKVLAVKDEYGRHMFNKGADQKAASDIIFSVDEDLNILLRKASYLNGTIVPVLRNSKYTDSEINKGATAVSSEYIRGLIEEKTVMLEKDVKEDQDSQIKVVE